MSKFSVIWKECYRRNIKSGSFIFMILMPLIMFGILKFVGDFMTNEQTAAATRPISIVTTEKDVLSKLVAANKTFKLVDVADEKDAMNQLNENKIVAYIVLKRDTNNQLNANLYRKATQDAVDTKEISALLTKVQQEEIAQALGVSLDKATAITSASVPVVNNKLNETSLAQGVLEVSDEGSFKELVRQMIAYGVLMIVYIILMTYINLIGQEIASEKGTRMMEVILSSTDAQTHFFGKLFGIILVVFTQLALYGIIGLVAWYVLDVPSTLNQLLNGLDVWEIAGDMLVITSILALLGILLFMVLSALCGSMVSKVEDVSKVMMPLILCGLLGFYIGMFGLAMPNNIVVKVASFIPLLSPFVMPFRLAVGAIGWMEISVIIGILVVFSVGVLYFSSMMYKANVLIYSDKGLLQVIKQSLTLMKNEKKAVK